MAESLSVLCNDLKEIRTYLCKIGPQRRQGDILIVKLNEAVLVLQKFEKLKNEVSELVKKGLLPSEEVTLFNKLSTKFNTLYSDILIYCQKSEVVSDTMEESFNLKTALSLLPVMTDDDISTKQLIDGIEYYNSVLKVEDQAKLIQFVLKSRLSQAAKLKLNSSYATLVELIKDMKKVLLPKKAATAIQSKLQNIRQDRRNVKDFGSEVAELFVDLTISQADGNSDSYKVLKPLNEKLAIKKFADGLRNRRLSTIIAARQFESLKDAIQAAQEEDEVITGSTSGEILDCVHLQLYKDLKERQKNGQTKASLSLQQYLGFEAGFTLDKESNTLAILCEDVVPVLAFDTREILIQWRVKVQHNLGSSKEFAAVIIQAPSAFKQGPARLHACGPRLALCANRPPEVLALWDVKLLRRFGIVDKRFCVEGGSRCAKGEGLFVFAAEGGRELTDLLNMYSHDAQSRLSIASRTGSVLEKRYSDTSSMDDGFPSLRSVSPWGPGSQTMHCISDLDSSLEEDKLRRPTSLPRCASCIGKISHLTRSSVGTPGSLMSPVWTMNSILEKRDCDRASMYSRSSGSASEYNTDSKRGSPVCCPSIPAKTGACCWQPKTCSCRKFSGPYENYDVPKTPMPLIQEHPIDGGDTKSLYDTPKKLKCLLNQTCNCSEAKNQTDTVNNESHSNYVNVTPIPEKPARIHNCNYANVDLSATLEKFESSLQILRSAGFSQEELDALEDIPENDDDMSTATTNTVHPSAECCNEHSNYMHMEPLEISSSSNSNKNCSDNISRISHVSDPTQHSESDTISTRRSSSADFTKRHYEDFQCFTPTVLRKARKNECINEGIPIINEPEAPKEVKAPEKSETTFVTRFRDAVKIRRSSSVPSKTDKNRDSSSSNDSGVSTGSLKHHKGDFEFEMPVTNGKSSKKFFKSNKPIRRALTPVNGPFVKSNSSDPLKNLTFHFEEVATMTKSNSCDVDTLTRRKKRIGDTDATARHSSVTNNTSSGASDTSDYMESLSVSSFSSCDVTADRHVTRPRSGKEYASIDRATLASVCDGTTA